MAASNSDDRRGVAKTEVKRKIDNDSTKPLAKRFKQIDINGDDQANQSFLLIDHIVNHKYGLEGFETSGLSFLT